MRSSTVGAVAKGFKGEEGCEDPHIQFFGLDCTLTPITCPVPDASEEQTETYIKMCHKIGDGMNHLQSLVWPRLRDTAI